MPRDQDYAEPQDSYGHLEKRLKRLEDAHDRMGASGPTTIHTVDPFNYIDPVQGEIANPHTDVSALPAKDLVVYHADQMYRVGGGTGTAWAALYSGAFVWGQQLPSDGNTHAIHFPAYTQSDGSENLFTFESFPDPDLLMPQIYKITLYESGVYTFDLSVFWLDPYGPEIVCYYGIGNESGGNFITPGDISQPFINLTLFHQTYRNMNHFSTWDFMEQAVWNTPVIQGGDPTGLFISCGCDIKDSAGNPVGSGDRVGIDARFKVIYHGPLNLESNEFNAQDA